MIQTILILTGILLSLAFMITAKRHAHSRHEMHSTPSPVLLTLSGTVTAHRAVPERPGCILELSNGKDTGLYYVKTTPNMAKYHYPIGERASVRVMQDRLPIQGVYETV